MCSAKFKPKSKESTLKEAAITTIQTKHQPQQFDLNDSVLPFAYIAPYKEKAGEMYMNTNQLKHFENILTTWQQHLVTQNQKTIEKIFEGGRKRSIKTFIG